MCCGGGNVAVAASALDDLVAFATNGAAPVPVEVNGPDVRLEFIGDQWGEQTFIGRASGKQYRAGRDPACRFRDVDARDVEYFVSTGLFAVVPHAQLVAAAQPDDLPLPVAVAPDVEVRPSRVKGRRVS